MVSKEKGTRKESKLEVTTALSKVVTKVAQTFLSVLAQAEMPVPPKYKL
jgi:hypothetical protein